MGSLGEEKELTSQNNSGGKKMRKRICVYCGARMGFSNEYAEAATQLGEELVRRGLDLVYGGGSVGMMGVVSRTVHERGGNVIGVIPEALMDEEISGPSVGTTIVVQNMHQRKSRMASLADCYIALPGGCGTLEELLEMITWHYLGIHSKPVGVLNVNNYYDPLLQMFDRMVETGFLSPDVRKAVVSAPTPSELIEQLDHTYRPAQPLVTRRKWIHRSSLGYANDDGGQDEGDEGRERIKSNVSRCEGKAADAGTNNGGSGGGEREKKVAALESSIAVIGM